jgi:hypothetical protein
MIYLRRVNNMERCNVIRCKECGKMFDPTDNAKAAKSLFHDELYYCPACLKLRGNPFNIPSNPEIDIDAIIKVAKEQEQKQLERIMKNCLGDA